MKRKEGERNKSEKRATYSMDSRLWQARLLAAVACLLLFSGCSERERLYRESRILMDTLCTVTVVETSKEEAGKAIKEVFQAIEHYEQLLNYFSSESEITAINRASGKKPVRVSRETLDLMTKSLKMAADTAGAFDPTVGPLMELWGFHRTANEDPPLPSDTDIQDALKHVGYGLIEVDVPASTVFLRKGGMKIDLGGIAKGYAADKAVEILMGKGIKSALVAIAGDIRGYGVKPDGQPWKVGFQNPRADEGSSGEGDSDIFATLSLQNSAISTSGDYQRFFMKNGKRYHHILDPATGYPSHDIMSVSVIAPEGFLADALSTGIFTLGREKGMELLTSLGLNGVIVDKNREIFLTDDLKGKVNIEKNF